MVRVNRSVGYNIAIFLNDFDNIVDVISKHKTECIICGDFNGDLLKSVSRVDIDCFENNLHAHLFVPLITRPTHFSANYSISYQRKHDFKLHLNLGWEF